MSNNHKEDNMPNLNAMKRDPNTAALATAADKFVQISSLYAGGVAALTAAGEAWVFDGVNLFQLPNGSGNRFVSVAGTPSGIVYALDEAGAIRRWAGGDVWTAVT